MTDAPSLPPIETLVCTVQEAAAALQLDPRTVRSMVRSGELLGNQSGRAIRVFRASVLDWACGKRARHRRIGA